jgi:methionyl aminopeptidase
MSCRRGIEIKTPAQLAGMRRAGLVVGRTLELLRTEIRPGVTTADLDRLAETMIRDSGAAPSFLGYHGFPATICASVNDEVVHGIPGSRVLVAGDVISVDCGAVVEGWHGDAAFTAAVGEVRPELARLMAVTESALWCGLTAGRLGGRLSDISAAVEKSVRSAGEFGIVEDYVGHGIGSAMHQPPDVPNVGRPGRGPELVPGLVLAIEPMVTLGRPATDVLDDDWTVVTRDHQHAAHFEHTVTWTDSGPWVLTAVDGGQASLAGLGVPYGGKEAA